MRTVLKIALVQIFLHTTTGVETVYDQHDPRDVYKVLQLYPAALNWATANNLKCVQL